MADETTTTTAPNTAPSMNRPLPLKSVQFKTKITLGIKSPFRTGWVVGSYGCTEIVFDPRAATVAVVGGAGVVLVPWSEALSAVPL